jgi:hypothetical protein
MTGVTIIVNTAGPLLERVMSAAQRSGLVLVAARAVANLVKSHLIELDTERHQFGRHYYLQAARSVTSRGGGDGLALVTATQTGIRQRLFGGLIKPGAGKKFLTLPNNPEDSGKRAREFNDLDYGLALYSDGSLRPALVRRASTAVSFIRRKQHDGTVKVTTKPGELRGGEVIFWLVRKVFQRPDPTVLPPREDMNATASDAMKRRILRLEGSAS